MDYKKTNAPLNTVTRDMIELSEDTGNVYETVCIIAKRANQIAGEMKHDLEKKLQEFASLNDNLEEISENREQIEISRYYTVMSWMKILNCWRLDLTWDWTMLVMLSMTSRRETWS